MPPRQEILKTLKQHVIEDPNYKTFREKTTNLNVLGLRLPVMYQIEQQGHSFYTTFDPTLKIYNTIWKEATTHEVMTQALMYVHRHENQLTRTHWKTLKTWINRIENWEHADFLCSIYSVLLEHFPDTIEPTLRQWNQSRNPWKQRASIVSTIYYASKKRTPPSRQLVFDLIKPLIPHQDPYVQKAVGWQLREAYNLWPKQTLALINQHLTDLSATSFSYATEKLSKEQKAPMKEKRKEHRKSLKGKEKNGTV